MGINKRKIGKKAEELAIKYLQLNDYRIIDTNYRCPIGEIDIIAENENYLVFIEVKYRKNTSYGMPREAVNYYKRQRIYKTALWYITKHSIHNKSMRFDVVELLGDSNNLKINIIKNAFWI